jgi:hypothetical protein
LPPKTGDGPWVYEASTSFNPILMTSGDEGDWHVVIIVILWLRHCFVPKIVPFTSESKIYHNPGGKRRSAINTTLNSLSSECLDLRCQCSLTRSFHQVLHIFFSRNISSTCKLQSPRMVSEIPRWGQDYGIQVISGWSCA